MSAEHKVERMWGASVERSVQDMRQLDRKVKNFSRRHPSVFGWSEVILLGLLVVTVIASQAMFANPFLR